MKTIFVTLLASILILTSQYVLASFLNINPVLLTLTREEPISILQLTNLSDNSVNIQADAVQWLQNKNVDVNLPTSDIIISPPFFQLAAHQSQLLRIAWIKNHWIDNQLTYRVILREIVPRHLISKAAPQKTLQIALAFSIPLFIQPSNQKIDYQWRAMWINSNKIELSLNNMGNMTLFLNEIQLSKNNNVLFSNKTFSYILPKQVYTWDFKIKKTDFDKVSARINGEWNGQSVIPIKK